jgi:hypothetical protein
MTSPRIVLPELPGCRSSVVVAPPAALISITGAKSGAPANPGCVVPSMVTASVIPGKPEVRTIVFGPDGAMLKLIVSRPAAAFASWMAARRVHRGAAPPTEQIPFPGVASAKSSVLSTVKTAAWAGPAARVEPSASEASQGASRARPARPAERLGSNLGRPLTTCSPREPDLPCVFAHDGTAPRAIEQGQCLNGPGSPDWSKRVSLASTMRYGRMTAGSPARRRVRFSVVRPRPAHHGAGRIAVTKAIKRAIDEISAANPVVGRHLALRVEAGTACRYRLESANAG